jgi:hypothetical protein
MNDLTGETEGASNNLLQQKTMLERVSEEDNNKKKPPMRCLHLANMKHTDASFTIEIPAFPG